MSFPYSYISCPCVDVSTATINSGSTTSGQVEDDTDTERTFDPRSLRTNFSLYPLDHLLWCEDCHEIRCPRCTIEEIVCWYCPNCLFEVPSSMVKTEGNRCTRNCFNCPICTASMSVSSIDTESNVTTGPWILACEYCHWTSLDIGLEFPKPNNIYTQFSKLHRNPSAIQKPSNLSPEPSPSLPKPHDPEAHFAALKSFYASQLSKTTPSNPLLSPSGEINYNSPSSLARIMSLYTTPYGKKSSSKPLPMNESADPTEGLHLLSRASSDAEVARLRSAGWQGTANSAQRAAQRQLCPPRFETDLRPVPTLLRTKRSKRCRTCRHILVKPEAKVQSTRYKIRLVAINYIPTLTLTAFPSSSLPDLNNLPPSKPIQFLLTLKNPLFEPVKITLATPSLTPGPRASKVTILCPQFEIGANADKWDEALDNSTSTSTSAADPKLRHRNSARPSKPDITSDGESRVAEAGKIWSRGRNWTSVVVEIVCALPSPPTSCVQAQGRFQTDEDENVLEVPIFVRGEWEGEVGGDEMGEAGEKESKERREVAFWCVLGVGKIAGMGG